MNEGVFVDTPTRPPRCGCGSERIVGADHIWHLVRLSEAGDQIINSLPIRIATCRDCGAVIPVVPWLELPPP